MDYICFGRALREEMRSMKLAFLSPAFADPGPLHSRCAVVVLGLDIESRSRAPTYQSSTAPVHLKGLKAGMEEIQRYLQAHGGTHFGFQLSLGKKGL